MLRITSCLFLLLCLAQWVNAQCNGSVNQCLGMQSYTVNPLPVNGQYYGGTVVTFCYTMQNYNQCNSNWIHTIDINLGPGWIASSIMPLSMPAACDLVGVWGFYSSVTSSITGLTFGPCFSYDSPSGSPGGALDGNPGNNYGDNCQLFAWTFCFSVQVAPGCNNQSLNVDVNAIGDGTSGAWTVNACPGSQFNLCTATCNSCPLSVLSNVVDPTCLDNNGFIEAFPDSAIGSVTYSWSPGGQATSSISNLSSGIYIVTVTDSIGCEALDTFNLSYTNPVSLNTLSTNASCYGYCDGTFYIFPSGGTEPYTYSWNSGQTISWDTALCIGTYYVTVTDSNSCIRIDTIEITQPSQIVLSTSFEDVSCFGAGDGWASVTAVGGAGSYSYSWSPSNQINDTAINLYAILYTVVVTDLSGCFADTTVTIGSPAQIQSNPVITDASCFGYMDGSIETNVTLGHPPYDYLWKHDGSYGTSLSNLFAGNYPLLITDANGCTELDSFLVSQPDSLIGVFDIVPASCPAASDGSVQIMAMGGTLPYSYEWNYDALLNGSGLFGQKEGMNAVEVTDDHGCVFTMADVIPALPDFIADAGSDTAIELGTSATLKATVSRPGIFYYEWKPGYHLVDSFSAITEAYPYYTTTYNVLITEVSSGCFDDDSVTVIILPSDFILFPTAFTPNGDGINDIFSPISGELITVESFKIFNRWGGILFDNESDGWDGNFSGRPEEMGTYVYQVTYLVEGRSQLYLKKGSFTLLR